MSIELGTAYLSVLPSSKGFGPAMQKLWGQTQKDAAKAGDDAGKDYADKATKNASKADLSKSFKEASRVASTEGSKAGKDFADKATSPLGKISDKIGKEFKEGASNGAAEGSKAGKEFTAKAAGPLGGVRDKIKGCFSGAKKTGTDAGKDAGKGFKDKFTAGAKGINLGSLLKAGVVLGAAKLGVDFATEFFSSIESASNRQQATGGVDAVFKNDSEVMKKNAKAAATTLGLSEFQYMESATPLGALIKNKGSKDVAGDVTGLINMGSDLAAMYGGTTAEAVEAITAGFKGEFNPLEKYGVAMKQDDITAKALSMGLGESSVDQGALDKSNRDLEIQARKLTAIRDKYGKDSTQYLEAENKFLALEEKRAKILKGGKIQLSDEDKYQATMALMGDQTADAKGAGAKEIDSLASKQQQTAAQWENLKADIGDFVLPLSEDLFKWISEKAMPALEGLVSKFEDLGKWFEDNKTTVELFKDILLGVAGAWGTYLVAVTAVKTPMAIATAAQWLFNAAMRANPIGLIVTAIGALVGGLIWAYNNVDWFREGVNKAFSWIWDLAKSIGAWFAGPFVDFFVGAFNWVKDALGKVGDFFAAVWEAIKIITAFHIGVILALISPFVDWFVARFEELKLVFSAAWTWIKDNILPIVATFLADIRKKWSDFVARITPIFDAFKKANSILWRAIKGATSRIVGGIYDNTIGKFKSIKDGVVGSVTGLRDTLSKIWGGIKKIFRDPINAVIGFINDPFITSINKVMESFGMSDKKIPLLKKIPSEGASSKGSTGGKNAAQMFAEGGWTGRGSKWTPAGIVHADEFVISKRARKAIEATQPGLLSYMNKTGKLPGYAEGGLVSYKGKTFTARFAAAIQNAEKLSGVSFRISQGGFRPRTSYSGTSHQGDALDMTPITQGVIRALRASGIAGWDRTGKGDWSPHVHGVPLPGYGSAAGSAVWQAQDYLRGGDGLGGRDNGPRILPGAVGDFTSDNSTSFMDGFGNLLGFITNPMKKLKEQLSGSFVGSLASGAIEHLIAGAKSFFKFDNGGFLQPGMTMALNKTGRPEPIFTTSQWGDISRVAALGIDAVRDTGTTEITVNAKTTSTAEEIAQEILESQKKAQRRRRYAAIA